MVQLLQTILLVVQVISALVVIGLVLLQKGKGADMGASFGGGSAGSLFGAAGSANFFSRMTKWFAIIFFATTLGLAYIQSDSLSKGRGLWASKAETSVLDQLPAEESTVPALEEQSTVPATPESTVPASTESTVPNVEGTTSTEEKPAK